MTAPAMALSALEHRVKAQAFGLGFDLVGIATLGAAETAPYFEEWLSRGYAGEMNYLPKWAGKRRDTRLPCPGVSSAVVVAMNYGGTQPAGPIARYARGDDYHDVMTSKLGQLHCWVELQFGKPVRGKAYIDTGPILERDLARRAGLGWFGKNTNLLNPGLGSFFFIGALPLDLELNPDPPFMADRCGTCRHCLDACPTNAFSECPTDEDRRKKELLLVVGFHPLMSLQRDLFFVTLVDVRPGHELFDFQRSCDRRLLPVDSEQVIAVRRIVARQPIYNVQHATRSQQPIGKAVDLVLHPKPIHVRLGVLEAQLCVGVHCLVSTN